MMKMAYLKFRKSRKIFMVILLLAVLALLAYLSLGPPRLLRAILAVNETVKFEVPPFSNHLMRPEAEYCPSVEKIAERTFLKGESFSLHGYQLILVIANPHALRLTLNGREVSYFRSSPMALKLIVNPNNLSEILQR
jgi:hypothetical protein